MQKYPGRVGVVGRGRRPQCHPPRAFRQHHENLRNVPADGVLVDGVVRQPHPEVAEDDHDQAGAVEGVGTGAAPPVGGAVVRGSLGHDRIAETLGARR